MSSEQEYIKKVALELLTDYVWVKQRQKEQGQCRENLTELVLLPPS